VERKNHLDGLAIGALLILCLSWSGQQVAIKLIAADISPVMQCAIRSIGATILVGLWAISRRVSLFERDGTLWWGIVVGLLFAIEFMLIYWALEFTHASRGVIFIYLAPFVVAVGAHIFLPDERLGLAQYVGLSVAFIGLVVAFGESFTLPSKQMLIGDSMMILAAILWGATTLVIKAGPLANISAGKTLLYQLAVSSVVLPIGSWLLNEPGIVNVSSAAVMSMVYQTVWIGSFTLPTWFWLIRHYPAPRLASFTFITPILGVFAGWLVLDEPLTAALLIAMALVAVGIYLVNRRTGAPATGKTQIAA
jgi:drug/metabolite transporter (DMT)-like permease